MTIETKYNIGDEVWFMCENKARQSYIVDIRIKCEKEDAENPFNDYPLFDVCHLHELQRAVRALGLSDELTL